MRTLTSQEARVYAAGRHNQRIRVQVLDSSRTWRDLTSLVGKDWLLGVRWDEHIDESVANCSVTLYRDSQNDSLALVANTRPNLVTGSYSQLIQVGREFKVETAILPQGIEPVSGDWREVFRGDIRDVDYGPSPMRFSGLDLGARLQRLFIETERSYGSGAGVAVQTVMQSIIKDNHGAAWTVNTAKSAGSGTVAGDRVTPTTQNGYWYRCTVGGTTHAATQPTWPTTIGNTVTDNTVTWRCEGVCPTLYTPTSPGFLLAAFTQKKEPLLDALKRLATENLGWDVRYRWRASSSQFELTFSTPDRATTTAVHTFDANHYDDVQQLAVSVDTIRNAMSGVYSDSADLDAAGIPKRKTVRREDPASQTKYTAGLPAWMELAEAATSQIDTAAEMTSLLDNAKSDLSEPVADQSILMPYWYPGELWDLYAFSANGVHYDSEQKFAVSSLRHDFPTRGDPKTVLLTRGKPAVAVLGWLRLEARPGSAPPAVFAAPDAPANLVLTRVAGGFVADFEVPTKLGTPAKWTEFELHVSTGSSFTPSSSTFYQRSTTNRFEVTDLAPGTTYYAKVVARDGKENRSATSSEVSIEAGYTTPTLMQPQVALGLFPPNPDFEARNASGSIFDTWSMDTGAWGTDANEEASTVYSGSKALKIEATATLTKVASQLFVVAANEDHFVESRVYMGTNAETNINPIYIGIRWYSDLTTVISTSLGPTYVSPINSWNLFSFYATAPSTARYARIVVGKNEQGGGGASNYVAYFDSALAQRVTYTGRGWVSGALLFGTNWTNVSDANYYDFDFLKDNAGQEVLVRGKVKRTSGAGATIGTLASGYRPTRRWVFTCANHSNGVECQVEVRTDGTIVLLGTYANNEHLALDAIRFRLD